MGFNNWNATHCRAEFNEQMVRQIADIFVARGLQDAGYTYVNLDDCWALPNRDGAGNLVPDPVRFPNGIKAVADYVHGKGLKFGIYTSAGTKTCNALGFPGAIGHEQQDANLFASWGVDYLKYDNCGDHLGQSAQERYTRMRDALRRHRPADPVLHLRMGPERAVGLGAAGRQQLAHHRRHLRQLGQHARDLQGQRRASRCTRSAAGGTTRTCSRSATAA